MTDLEIQYNQNAQKCRAMCHYLELLVEEMKYHDSVLDVHNKEITIIKINDIKSEIENLFDSQIDLYMEIADFNKRKSKLVHMERMQMLSAQATK